MTKPVIQITYLTYRFGETKAVENLSLAVETGIFLAFLATTEQLNDNGSIAK